MGHYMFQSLHGVTQRKAGTQKFPALDLPSYETRVSPIQGPSLHRCLSLPMGSFSPLRVPSALSGGAPPLPIAAPVVPGPGPEPACRSAAPPCGDTKGQCQQPAAS